MTFGNSMKKVIKIVIIIVAVVSLFIFFRSLYCNHWLCNIEYSQEVSPLDIINIIVTSSVAIYLGHYITKKLSAERYEKEFIIDDLRLIESNIGDIYTYFKGNSSKDVSEVGEKIEILGKSVERLKTTLSVFNYSISVSSLEDKLKKLYAEGTNFDGNIWEPDKDTAQIAVCMSYCGIMTTEIRKIVKNINDN